MSGVHHRSWFQEKSKLDRPAAILVDKRVSSVTPLPPFTCNAFCPTGSPHTNQARCIQMLTLTSPDNRHLHWTPLKLRAADRTTNLRKFSHGCGLYVDANISWGCRLQQGRGYSLCRVPSGSPGNTLVMSWSPNGHRLRHIRPKRVYQWKQQNRSLEFLHSWAESNLMHGLINSFVQTSDNATGPPERVKPFWYEDRNGESTQIWRPLSLLQLTIRATMMPTDTTGWLRIAITQPVTGLFISWRNIPVAGSIIRPMTSPSTTFASNNTAGKNKPLPFARMRCTVLSCTNSGRSMVTEKISSSSEEHRCDRIQNTVGIFYPQIRSSDYRTTFKNDRVCKLISKSFGCR